MADFQRWFEDPGNVVLLAHWLCEREEICSVKDCIYYFEKPWKWDAEWQEMMGERSAACANLPR